MRTNCIIAFCLLLLSCKSNSITENTNSNLIELFPLKKGNTWITRRELWDSTGVVKSIDYDTLTIVRDTIIGNLKWFISNKSSYLRNGDNGFYTYDTISQFQILLFKYPSNINDSISISFTNDQYCTLVATTDSIMFNERKYLSYVYRWYKGQDVEDYRIWIDYFTFIPNIGIVNSENIVIYTYNNTKGMWIKSTLEAFILG